MKARRASRSCGNTTTWHGAFNRRNDAALRRFDLGLVSRLICNAKPEFIAIETTLLETSYALWDVNRFPTREKPSGSYLYRSKRRTQLIPQHDWLHPPPCIPCVPMPKYELQLMAKSAPPLSCISNALGRWCSVVRNVPKILSQHKAPRANPRRNRYHFGVP